MGQGQRGGLGGSGECSEGGGRDRRGRKTRHAMEDVIDEEVTTTAWVAGEDSDASVPVRPLRIHLDELIDVGNGDDFDEDESDEEYESYTGNAGPTVEYIYHMAVLVLWPAAGGLRVALSLGFPPALAVVRARIKVLSADHGRALLQELLDRVTPDHDLPAGALCELITRLGDAAAANTLVHVLKTQHCHRGDVRGVASDEWAAGLAGLGAALGWERLLGSLLSLLAACPARVTAHVVRFGELVVAATDEADAAVFAIAMAVADAAVRAATVGGGVSDEAALRTMAFLYTALPPAGCRATDFVTALLSGAAVGGCGRASMSMLVCALKATAAAVGSPAAGRADGRVVALAVGVVAVLAATPRVPLPPPCRPWRPRGTCCGWTTRGCSPTLQPLSAGLPPRRPPSRLSLPTPPSRRRVPPARWGARHRHWRR